MRVFNVDISRKGISPVVQVTEYDAMSRFFTLVLRDGTEDYEEPEAATYSVWYKTKDSHGWYDTITEPDNGTHPAVVADGNAYTIEIAEQATTSCGELALCITAPGGYQLTISGIITRSDDIPGYDGSEVENYYNVYITQMVENAARAENAADIAVAYGATVEVDEDEQQLNITHHSDTEGGVGWLFGSAVVTEAEGSVAAFPDGANDVAVKSLVAEITPVQSGSGDPSPENIRPISGRTGMTVTRAGKNLLNDSIKTPNSGQTSVTFGQTAGYSTPSYFMKAGTYTFSVTFKNGASAAGYMKKAGDSGNTVLWSSGGHSATFTLSEDTLCSFWIFNSAGIAAADVDAQIEAGTSATAYEPYTAQTYPITWQTEAGTVYGGTLDVVSGVLTVDRFFKAFDGTETGWTKAGGTSNNTQRYYILWENMGVSDGVLNPSDALCSHLVFLAGNAGQFGTFNSTVTNFEVKDGDGSQFADINAFKAWLAAQNTNGTPLQLCVELATPQTYQLTPTEIKTLLGGNTIYTDAGSVSVEYVADTKLYIDNKVAELQALILEN